MSSKLRTFALLAVPVLIVIMSVIALALYLIGHNPNARKQIQYGPNNVKDANELDLYLPEKSVEAFPLIIWIHGGGWIAGDKYPSPARLLVKEGFAVASINYRLTKEAIFPAQIEDCKLALSFLRKNAAMYHLDPNRIGVWGASAGGHLAALIGTTGDAEQPAWASTPGVSNKVQAVCDWCGPSDLTTIKAQSGPVVVMDHASPDGPVSRLLGGTFATHESLAREASPITYVHTGCPPFLIMHGDLDELVPTEQSRELASEMIKAGNDCQLIIIAKGGHDFYSPTQMATVTAFFKKHLAAAGSP